MQHSSKLFECESCYTMLVDDIELIIIASRICDGEWQLAVENDQRVRSVWDEFFPTAKAAINAGVEAIKTEGPENFTDMEGFDYALSSKNGQAISD